MIRPSESSGPAADVEQAPAGKRPVYLGVLRLDSPLLEIWPGRIVPLRHQDPKMIRVETPEGPRFLMCMLVPFNGLMPEHQAAVVAKVACELSQPIEASLTRLKVLGFYAIQRIHFAAVLEAQEKKE